MLRSYRTSLGCCRVICACVQEDAYPYYLGHVEHIQVRPSSHYIIQTDIYCESSPVYIQEALSDASQGRKAASITKIEGAGHMASLLALFLFFCKY